jgi:hypothetical protein
VFLLLGLNNGFLWHTYFIYYNFYPSPVLVYHWPRNMQSQIGQHINSLNTEKQSNTRGDCNSYWNCFCWKALTSYLGPQITKSRRKAWHLYLYLVSVITLNHFLRSHFAIILGSRKTSSWQQMATASEEHRALQTHKPTPKWEQLPIMTRLHPGAGVSILWNQIAPLKWWQQ